MTQGKTDKMAKDPKPITRRGRAKASWWDQTVLEKNNISEIPKKGSKIKLKILLYKVSVYIVIYSK